MITCIENSQEYERWSEICPDGGYPDTCNCNKNDCEIEAWKNTVYGQNFCLDEGLMAPPSVMTDV